MERTPLVRLVMALQRTAFVEMVRWCWLFIENLSQSYGALPAIWDHTCHPALMNALRDNLSQTN